MNSGRARQRADDLQARLKRRLDRARPGAPALAAAARRRRRRARHPARAARAAPRRAHASSPALHARETGARRADRRRRRARRRARARPRPRGEAAQQPRLRHPLAPDATAADCSSSRSRAASPGADTFTITKNEVLYALNKADRLRPRARPRRRGRSATTCATSGTPFTGSDEVLLRRDQPERRLGRDVRRGAAPA